MKTPVFIKSLNKKALKINKRLRFVISATILTAVMLFSTFFFFDRAIFFIPLLALLSYVLTYFAILEGIEKNEWVNLFIMPVILSIAFYYFYFLVPGRWLTRLPFVVIYAISIYALMLCSNIFNVGVEKNLQLYRAAFSINFFYQTVVYYLILNIIFSFKLNFIANGILVSLFTGILSLQFFWTQKLRHNWEKEILIFVLLISVMFFEAAVILSFVPLDVSIFALFLTALYYCLVGLIFNFLDQRLFKETIREYLIVLGFVLIITLLSISW